MAYRMNPHRRQFASACLLGATAGVVLNTVAATSANPQLGPMPLPVGKDGRHDFDFFHGRWHLHNRRLKSWLSGSQEWIEFEGKLYCQPVLDGLGNIDELTADFGDGIHGVSLRLYDPASGQWSDYWASKRNGLLNPPVVGSFSDGVGVFHGRDEHEGRPVLVRALWKPQSPAVVEWAQAYSVDRGQTWETNWTMRMTRQA